MKLRLLIATADTGYQEHLSKTLWEKYADTFEINVCSAANLMKTLNRYDVALIEPDFLPFAEAEGSCLSIVLMDESGVVPENAKGREVIRKYQRISSMVGEILEKYAAFDAGVSKPGIDKAHITAVWSPAGGVGKTTVAAAFAAYKASGKKHSVYFNLEYFSSAPTYFPEKGKSISTVFGKLESNVHILLTSIRQKDSESGVTYFTGPDNYDDINELKADDIETLIKACAAGADELVIDLPNSCDERVQKALELADTVLLVCDASAASQTKINQFSAQHNVWHQIEGKTVLINNKGANMPRVGVKSLRIPFVEASSDPVFIYKTLAGGKFEW